MQQRRGDGTQSQDFRRLECGHVFLMTSIDNSESYLLGKLILLMLERGEGPTMRDQSLCKLMLNKMQTSRERL
jgi:hypothetical protein